MIEFRKGTFMDINELVRMRLAYIADDRGEIEKNILKQIKDSLPECFEKHLNKDLFAYIACDNSNNGIKIYPDAVRTITRRLSR